MAKTTNKTTRFGFMTNPAIRRLQKVEGLENTSERATYGGVAAKTVYFLIWTVIGIVAFFVLNNYLLNVTPETFTVIESEDIFQFSMTIASIGAVGIAGIVTLVTALISIFAMSAIPLVGTIYSIAQGYLLAFITDALRSEYEWIGLLALMLTVIIVATLLFLYASGKIRVNQKFRSVITTLFITIIVSSILLIIFSFIPGLQVISMAVASVTANPIISIVLSAVFIVIACMFLVSDFDAVRQLVENGLPKKYEWSCAFGIAYTVLYLYLKILELIVNIASHSSSNK